ncbi:MAG: DUF2156 domain-containing protein [Lachnospiraceae bacterium]|nr:DUF2156 domain-containing protein [Lachnospiraceae bacterium]
MEIQFKRPEMADRQLIQKYLWQQRSQSCEMTFANVYLWSRHYPTGFAIVEDMLVFANLEGELSFTFPWGERDPRPALEALMAYSQEQGTPFLLHNVTRESFARLEELYPGRFAIAYDRTYADYIYETEKLANLAGKKYHGKKNHVNKFLRTYPDWSYESMGPENMEECFQMALKWREHNGCEADEEKLAEICVTLNFLRLFQELEMQGGLLRVNGQVVAFTIGEPVCEDTMVVHIEKALHHVPGAYAMINQQFALHQGSGYQYLNREDDVGEEGLRKAKLSYHPVYLVEKGVVRELGCQ